MVDGDDSSKQDQAWRKSILSLIQNDGESNNNNKIKKLRKNVLLSMQLDEDDKSAKKQFKRIIQGLETDGTISLNEDGIITLLKGKNDNGDDKKSKKKKRKEKKQKKKDKKRKSHDNGDGDDDDNRVDSNSKKQRSEEDVQKEHQDDNDDERNEDDDGDDDGHNQTNTNVNKNKPCKGNPQGITRLFVGNLPFSVDETSLGDFLGSSTTSEEERNGQGSSGGGQVTHIKWITDKETGQFYGSAFVEMDTSLSAANAVSKAGSQLMGRPIKVNYAPAREGDIWPPVGKKVISGGGQAGGTGVKAMGPKPENCVKLFIGNLSYDIDDEAIKKFFASVDAELKAVRWLHHKDSGDFKGWYVSKYISEFEMYIICILPFVIHVFCLLVTNTLNGFSISACLRCFPLYVVRGITCFHSGFVEFWDTQSCDKAAQLKGKNLLGRPIRIDWSD